MYYISRIADFISPICLPTTPNEIGMSYTGKNLVVAGWGKTEAKVPSEVKLKLVVKRLSVFLNVSVLLYLGSCGTSSSVCCWTSESFSH